MVQDISSSRLIYMGAVLDALRINGGIASSKDVYEFLRKSGVARAIDIVTLQKSGESRFVKEVRFSRKELFDAGLVIKGVYGTWALSPTGWQTDLSPDQARALIRRRRHGDTNDAGLPADNSPVHEVTAQPTKGPEPRCWTKLVSRSADVKAWTYVMRYGVTDVWKIGYTSDLMSRLKELNAHVPFEVTNASWFQFACYPWPISQKAYAMEQRLLEVLHMKRTSGERVRCSEDDLMCAWRRVAVEVVASAMTD